MGNTSSSRSIREIYLSENQVGQKGRAAPKYLYVCTRLLLDGGGQTKT